MEKNPFENIKNKGKKVLKNTLIAGGLALGVLSHEQVEAQGIITPGIEINTFDSEANRQYSKLLAHRDSVLEYNKQIEKMNANAERLAQEFGKYLLEYWKFYVSFNTDFDKKKFKASTNIKQNSSSKQDLLSSAGSVFSGKHELQFDNFDVSECIYLKTSTVPFSNFDKENISFELVGQMSKIPGYVQNFYNQYTDTKTNQHPKYNPNRGGLYDIDVLNVLHNRGEDEDKEPNDWKFEKDLIFPLQNGPEPMQSAYQIAHLFSDNQEHHIPRNEISMESIETIPTKEIFVYKKIKPKSIKISIYQKVLAELRSPGIKDDFIAKNVDDIAVDQATSSTLYMICEPVWEKKPIPKIPKKEKYIEEYKQKHQNEIPVSKKDTVLYIQKPVIDTQTKKPQTVLSSAINPESKDEFKSEESGYPVYGGPHRVYMGVVTESGKFIPTKDREHIDIPYFDEDRKILEKYDRGETDQDFDRILKEYGYKEKK